MIGIDLPPVDYAAHTWAASAGRPFRHLIWPGALTPLVANLCGDEYPAPDSGAWHTFTGELEAGKQEGVAAIAGRNIAALHHTLNGPLFMDWLRRMTGITNLVPDPDRVGGGIHQSGPGARLGLHVDFNLHPTRHYLVRAVNLIVFVGDPHAWLMERAVSQWGGLLELGAPNDPDRLEVIPMPCDMVIFEAADDSWHGHPVPLAADAPLRKSVPAYYYRPIRDGEIIEGRSTRFLAVQ